MFVHFKGKRTDGRTERTEGQSTHVFDCRRPVPGQRLKSELMKEKNLEIEKYSSYYATVFCSILDGIMK